MNRTLERVKASANLAAELERHAARERHAQLKEQAEAAADIIAAFRDLEDQYVRISVLRQVWPNDYQKRNDRVRGLLSGIIEEDGEPYGIDLLIPGGHLRYTAHRAPDGAIYFSASKDIGSVRPTAMDFVEKQDWLDFFYRTMAQIIEI